MIGMSNAIRCLLHHTKTNVLNNIQTYDSMLHMVDNGCWKFSFIEYNLHVTVSTSMFTNQYLALFRPDLHKELGQPTAAVAIQFIELFHKYI